MTDYTLRDVNTEDLWMVVTHEKKRQNNQMLTPYQKVWYLLEKLGLH